jgi:hypothetical protein
MAEYMILVWWIVRLAGFSVGVLLADIATHGEYLLMISALPILWAISAAYDHGKAQTLESSVDLLNALAFPIASLISNCVRPTIINMIEEQKRENAHKHN